MPLYPPAVTPASPTDSVQYNRAGLFGGESAFIYDETNNELRIGGGSTQNGKLALQLEAADTNGLYIDGTTSPFSTVGGDATALALTRSFASTGEPFGTNKILNATVTNANAVSSASDEATWENRAIEATLTVTGAHSTTAFIPSETNMLSNYILTRSGTITAPDNISIVNYGLLFQANDTTSYNAAGGTGAFVTTALDVTCSQTGTQIAGTLTKLAKGARILVAGNTSGSSSGYGIDLSVYNSDTNYGLYLNTISGGSVNYGIYDNAGAPHFLKGPTLIGSATSSTMPLEIRKNSGSTTLQRWNNADGTTTFFEVTSTGYMVASPDLVSFDLYTIADLLFNAGFGASFLMGGGVLGSVAKLLPASDPVATGVDAICSISTEASGAVTVPLFKATNASSVGCLVVNEDSVELGIATTLAEGASINGESTLSFLGGSVDSSLFVRPTVDLFDGVTDFNILTFGSDPNGNQSGLPFSMRWVGTAGYLVIGWDDLGSAVSVYGPNIYGTQADYLGGVLYSGYPTLAGANTFTNQNIFQKSADSTTAFLVNNSAATKVLTVDTTNRSIGIGSVGASSTSLVQLTDTGATPKTNMLSFSRGIASRVVAAEQSLSVTHSWTGAGTGTLAAIQGGTWLITDSRTITSTTGDLMRGLRLNATRSSSFSSSTTTNGTILGFDFVATDGGTYTSVSPTLNLTAVKISGTWSPVLNGGGGSAATYDFYGVQSALITVAPVITSGTLTMRHRAFVDQTPGTTTGTTLSASFYSNSINWDTMYAFWNDRANHMYMGFDNAKTYWGTNTNVAGSFTGALGDYYESFDGTSFLYEMETAAAGAAFKFNSVALTDTDFEVYSDDGIMLHLDAGAGTSYFRPKDDLTTAFVLQDAAGNSDVIYDATNALLNVQGAFQCDTITNDTGLAAGTYTPTLTNTTNIDSSTAYQAQYLRVGNAVTVSGKVDIEVNTDGVATVLGMSLPVASNIGATEDVAGVAATLSGAITLGTIISGNTANDRATFEFTPFGLGTHTFYFTFTYQVI